MTGKFFTLILIAISLPGCQRFDRENVPASQKVMGLINKEQFKARAFRQQYFDHVPAPRYDDQPTYQDNEASRYYYRTEEEKKQLMYAGRDQSYEEGFQAGCQTFTSAIGSGLARLRDTVIDADKLSENPWYLRGYQDASAYCTHALDWETH
ncbi:MAG: hypothetical protein COV35_08675 [Alphaproteobacteria bacterium CG11_big_fil_rev_8_21_14_0_20_39_49]|nr:MAG: hypothetical protein COV35_08675 [Alphaproteobacteria bacterium CG11_big_fil_rev_8_21_14_0_20_39_49]